MRGTVGIFSGHHVEMGPHCLTESHVVSASLFLYLLLLLFCLELCWRYAGVLVRVVLDGF